MKIVNKSMFKKIKKKYIIIYINFKKKDQERLKEVKKKLDLSFDDIQNKISKRLQEDQEKLKGSEAAKKSLSMKIVYEKNKTLLSTKETIGVKIIDFFNKFATSSLFNISSLLIIISNFGILVVESDESSEKKMEILGKVNVSLTFLLLVEIIIKIIAFGLKNYLKHPLDQIDVFILVLNLIEVIYDFAVEDNPFIPTNGFSPFVQSLKIIRIFRFFIQIPFLSNGAMLLLVIIRTFKKMLSWMLIIFLFILAATIVGMEMFAYRIRFVDGDQVPKDL